VVAEVIPLSGRRGNTTEYMDVAKICRTRLEEWHDDLPSEPSEPVQW